MNKLAITALFGAVLLQAAGCIITTDDPDEVVGGSFNVSWSVTGGCPTADAAVEVISQNRAVAADKFTDIYNCTDGGGVTALMPLGDYDVWVEVTDAAGTTLLAQSNLAAGSLIADGDLVNVAIDPFHGDMGFFGVTWNLVDTAGTALTCAEVFSGGVDIVATVAGTSDATADLFNCEDGQGVTDPLALGTYTVVVEILDQETPPGALGISTAVDESITFGNELVDLGNKEFEFQ